MKTIPNGMRAALLGAAVLIALALPSAAPAATTNTWIGGTGAFETGANWSPAAMPVTGDIALYTNAGSYTVNFNKSATNNISLISGGGTVTFNLGGYTYLAALGTNQVWAGESDTFTVNGATLRVSGGGNLQFLSLNNAYFANGIGVISNGLMIVENGSKVLSSGQYDGFYLNTGGKLVVDGVGSEFRNVGTYGQAVNGDFTVQNGGLLYDTTAGHLVASGAAATYTVTGAGSKLYAPGGMSTSYGGGLSLIVSNGAEAWINGITLVGDTGLTPDNLIAIGGPGTTAMLVSTGGVYLGANPVGNDLWGAVGHATIKTNGILRVLRGNLLVGDGDLNYDATSSVNLESGTIQMGTNTLLHVQKNDQADNTTPVLRGSGSISKYDAGANFTLLNEGWIRPGDTGFSTNNTAGLGVLSITGGNLIQTNSALTRAGMFFQFAPAGSDQIKITDGFARITAGSNAFSLATGAPSPVHGVKYGVGVFDFLVATNITWSPQYDNLVNLLTNTYHLTYGVDFQYGVVNLGGGLFALELAFVPEPSTVLLLVLGGLLVWRRISKKTTRQLGCGALLGAAVLIALASPALAQVTGTWTAASGTFAVGGNWDISRAPTNSDAAFFTQNSTYQVDFDRNATNAVTKVNAGTVTFNLAGYNYRTGAGLPPVAYNEGFTVSNSTLTITGGGTLTATAGAYQVYPFKIANGGTLLIQGGSKVVSVGGGYFGWSMVGGNAALVIDGSGSELRDSGGYYAGQNGNVTVQNGGLLSDSTQGMGPNDVPHTILVKDSGSRMFFQGITTGYGGILSVLVTNGAELWTAGISLQGANAAGTNHVMVGGPGLAALLVSSNEVSMGTGILGGNDAWGGYGMITVLTNGTFRRVGAGTGIALGDGSAGSLFTLNQGVLQMGAGLKFMVQSNDGANATIPTLRGAGTISKYGAGANFSLLNEGAIRPGDLTTNAALGTLTFVGGDFYQTNVKATAAMYLQFSDTGLDQINLQNGFARITTGSNVFALASGAPSPVHGVKYGLGVYDFIIGTNVTYTPQYDNLVNLLTNTYHLTYGVDFQYGVVNLGGGLFALELAFVPEPSTVLLLALGGLLVFRLRRGFGGQGRRKAGKAAGAIIACGLILALAGGSARAQTTDTNFWTGGVNTDFNTVGNWSKGHVPTATEFATFTNVNSASSVQLSGNTLDYGLLMVNNTSLTVDLNGKSWTNKATVHNSSLTTATITNGAPGTIKFSSSIAGGKMTTYNSGGTANSTIIGRNANTTIIVDDSLGAPVLVTMQGSYPSYAPAGGQFGNLVVSGAGTEYRVDPVYYEGAVNPGNSFSLGGNFTVTNGGLFSINGPFHFGQGASVSVTGLVSAGFLKNGVSTMTNKVGADYGPATLTMSNNSIWTDSSAALQVGVGRNADSDNYSGKLTMDGSTFNGQGLVLGGRAYVGPPHLSPGLVQILNGSTMVLSNGYLFITTNNYLTATNTLVLNNSTIKIGRTGVNGVITNMGIVRAAGTITGQGAGNFRFVNFSNSVFEVGSSIGTLTLNKGDLELQPTSKALFEFSATGRDQIVASNGFVNLLGTNLFSVVGPGPVHGAKYGLGVYDFIIATNITKSTQYDNLVNLLTNTYHLTYGVDFQYGVVDLHNGLFALELTFVPEPSTVMLLALGGLLIWRRAAKRNR